MLKRVISLILCVLLILSMGLCLCSCKDKKGDEYPVTIGDVTIEKEPLNIVVLSDSLADIISYMGYDLKMVGRNIECDQEFLSIVPIVGSAQAPNVDAIITYEADLVITENTLSDATKRDLSDAKIPVVTLSKATSFEELKALYRNLGTVLGGNVTGKAQGESSYDELIKTLDTYEDAIPNDLIKTACYLYLNENNELCTLTKGSIEYSLFDYCGAINIFPNQETATVDLEQLKIGTPTYIFYDNERVLDYLENDSELSTIGAVERGDVFEVKKSYFYRQGTTCEELIYRMIEYMFILDEATKDEAATEEVTE